MAIGTNFDQLLLQIGQAYNSVLSEQARLQQDRNQFEIQLKLQMANMKAREEGLNIEKQNLALRKQNQEFDQLLDFVKFKHNVDIDRETLQLKKAEAAAPGKETEFTTAMAKRAREERTYKDLLVKAKEELTATEEDSSPDLRHITSIEELQKHLNGILTERSRFVAQMGTTDIRTGQPLPEVAKLDGRIRQTEAELQRRTKKLTSFYGSSPAEIMEATRRSMGATEPAVPATTEVSPLSAAAQGFLKDQSEEARQTLKAGLNNALFGGDASWTKYIGELYNALPEGSRDEEQLQKLLDSLK